MAEKMPQTYKNHARLDPPYHQVLLPVLAANLVFCIWNLVRHPGFVSAWLVVLTLAGGIAVVKIRTYALKAQDRVIRLEERLRLATVLPEAIRLRIRELTEEQLIALRFASDAELPALVEKTLAQNFSRVQIKEAITNWRPDYFRI